MTSSLPTFIIRPKAWWGAALSQAARIQSGSPMRMPVGWGPRRTLPPL